MKTRAHTTPFGLAALAGTVLALTASAMAQPQLLKDINPGAPDITTGSFPDGLFQIRNDLIYFAADHPITGTELYRTDGTAAGTSIISDFNPGAGTGPIEIGIGGGILIPYLKFARATGTDRMFFFGQSPSFGYELCITDGTSAGTQCVRDVAPGANFGVTGGANGVLFGTNTRELDVALVSIAGQGYYGCTNLVNGAELTTSDGTFAGTQQVLDVNQAAAPTGSPSGQLTGSSSIRYITLTSDNKIVFAAVDGQTLTGTNALINGLEFYIYDPALPVAYNVPTVGTPGANLIGNPKRISNLNGTADGAQFWYQPAIVGNFVYWGTTNAAGTANHLMRYNYTLNNPAIDQSNTSVAVSRAEQATNIVAGGTPMRVQFDPVAVGAGTSQRVLFISNSGDGGGTTLWSHDPNAALPNAIRVSVTGAFPRRGVAVGGKCVYWATSGANSGQTGYPGGVAASPNRGWELYATDGIAGVGSALTNVTDNMIREYNATPGVSGAATVIPTIDLSAANAAALVYPTYIYSKNGLAWFGASTIGTLPAIVTPLTAAGNGPGGANQASNAATSAWQPYTSNGTAVGSPLTPVRIMNPLDGPLTAGANATPFAVEKLNASTVMFSGFSPAEGREPWRSDGSLAGTTLVKDIGLSYTDSLPAIWTSMPNAHGDVSNRETKIFQNRVFFNAFSASAGRELWTAVGVPVSGTADTSTVQVGDINPTLGSGSNPGQMTPVLTGSGWRLFFGATDHPAGGLVGNGYEVMQVALDGTTGVPLPAAIVTDLLPGAGNGNAILTAANLQIALAKYSAAMSIGGVGNYLYIGANGVDVTVDPLSLGRELYVTDGTTTTLVKDINVGVGPSQGFMTTNTANDWAGGVAPPGFLQLANGKVVFAAVDGVTSTDIAATTTTGLGEPYITDGTAVGTTLLDAAFDINASGGSGPIQFAQMGATALHPLGAVLYWANDGLTGQEPWIYDIGTNTTTQMADINGTGLNVGSYGGTPFAITGPYAVFSASDGIKGTELYVYNGNTGAVTGAMNNAAFDLNTFTGGAASSFPGPFNILPDFLGGADHVVFDCNDTTHGYELWEFNPAAPYAVGVNPHLLKDLNPGFPDGTGGNYAVGGDPVPGPNNMGQWLYFDGNDGARGFEPWRYTGRSDIVSDWPVVGGLEFLGDLIPGVDSSQPNTFFVDSTVFAQITYFSAFKPDVPAFTAPSGIEPHFFVTKCGPADISFLGGDFPGAGTKDSYYPPDGQITVDDVIVFFNAFGDGGGCPSANLRCNPADITSVGGPVDLGTGDLLGPDGQLTVDDIIVFINGFGDGC